MRLVVTMIYKDRLLKKLSRLYNYKVTFTKNHVFKFPLFFDIKRTRRVYEPVTILMNATRPSIFNQLKF